MRYTADNLLVHPAADPRDPDLVQRITPRSAGWDYIHFEVRRLAKDRTWSFAVTDFELAFVDLRGRFSIESNRGRWTAVGGRRDVFQGGAHALYLPRHTEFTVTAEEAGDFAVAWVPTDQDHAPWLIRPDR